MSRCLPTDQLRPGCTRAAPPVLTSGSGCRQGLGNRLPSLVTGFALALLTDRVLLVDDSAGRYFGIFSPTFDCNYTQSRREARQIAKAAGFTPSVRVARARSCRTQSCSVLDPRFKGSHPAPYA